MIITGSGPLYRRPFWCRSLAVTASIMCQVAVKCGCHDSLLRLWPDFEVKRVPLGVREAARQRCRGSAEAGDFPPSSVNRFELRWMGSPRTWLTPLFKVTLHPRTMLMAPFCVCASANKHQARRAVRNGDGAQLLARSFFFLPRWQHKGKLWVIGTLWRLPIVAFSFYIFFLLPLPSNVSLFSFLFPLLSLFSSLPFFYSLSLSPDFFPFFSSLFSFLLCLLFFSFFSFFSFLDFAFIYIFFSFSFFLFSLFSFLLSFFFLSHLSPPKFYSPPLAITIALCFLLDT